MTPTRSVKPKKCANCRCEFIPERMGQKVCCLGCAVAIAKKKREKVERANDRQKRDKLKTRSQWMKEAQIAFNAFCRERDKQAGYPCISSGRQLDWNGNGVDAGHYRSVGSAPHLRFNEDNCHAQSKQDNRYGGGCVAEYRLGLIRRIGLEAVERLEADQEPKHYTIEDLKAIKAKYVAKLKEMRNGHDD